MIKAVTFDLDGTLIDSTEAIVNSFMHTFRVLGAPPPKREAIVNSIGNLLKDQFRLLGRDDIERSLPIYRKHYGAEIADDAERG